MQLKGRHLRDVVRSVMTSTGQDNSVELESGTKSTRKTTWTHRTNWNDSLNLSPKKNISNETAVTTSKATPATDRDDIMLMGINVQRDVLVE